MRGVFFVARRATRRGPSADVIAGVAIMAFAFIFALIIIALTVAALVQ